MFSVMCGIYTQNDMMIIIIIIMTNIIMLHECKRRTVWERPVSWKGRKRRGYWGMKRTEVP
jgi:hypothetical protein